MYVRMTHAKQQSKRKERQSYVFNCVKRRIVSTYTDTNTTTTVTSEQTNQIAVAATDTDSPYTWPFIAHTWNTFKLLFLASFNSDWDVPSFLIGQTAPGSFYDAKNGKKFICLCIVMDYANDPKKPVSFSPYFTKDRSHWS